MTQRKYFGTDGIRGKVGESNINPEFIYKTRLGLRAGVLAGRGTNKVFIGKDTRISGYLLESSLRPGLSAWYQYRLLGPMPTPAIAYLTKTFRARSRDSD